MGACAHLLSQPNTLAQSVYNRRITHKITASINVFHCARATTSALDITSTASNARRSNA